MLQELLIVDQGFSSSESLLEGREALCLHRFISLRGVEGFEFILK